MLEMAPVLPDHEVKLRRCCNFEGAPQHGVWSSVWQEFSLRAQNGTLPPDRDSLTTPLFLLSFFVNNGRQGLARGFPVAPSVR